MVQGLGCGEAKRVEPSMAPSMTELRLARNESNTICHADVNACLEEQRAHLPTMMRLVIEEMHVPHTPMFFDCGRPAMLEIGQRISPLPGREPGSQSTSMVQASRCDGAHRGSVNPCRASGWRQADNAVPIRIGDGGHESVPDRSCRLPRWFSVCRIGEKAPYPR